MEPLGEAQQNLKSKQNFNFSRFSAIFYVANFHNKGVRDLTSDKMSPTVLYFAVDANLREVQSLLSSFKPISFLIHLYKHKLCRFDHGGPMKRDSNFLRVANATTVFELHFVLTHH